LAVTLLHDTPAIAQASGWELNPAAPRD